MQVNFKQLKHDPNYVAWVECTREELDQIKEIFPVENYEILVGIKTNYNPITCDIQTLHNPPAPTWGVDIRKRNDAGHKTISLNENP
jgi:hypothetical protein